MEQALKQFKLILIFCCISMSALGDDLLIKFNKEIEPYKKSIKYNSVILHRLADKELSGEKLTNADYKKVFFINCSSLGYMNKMLTISKKTEYKNLDKAKKSQLALTSAKGVMEVTEKDCENGGMPIPLK